MIFSYKEGNKKRVVVATIVGGIMFINTSAFSYDLLKSSDMCRNSGCGII
jgi:hypothetical protein